MYKQYHIISKTEKDITVFRGRLETKLEIFFLEIIVPIGVFSLLNICAHIWVYVNLSVNWQIKIFDLIKNHKLPWKYLVWNLVKAQPKRKSNSCLASTLRASFSFGCTRFCIAALMSLSVMAEKRALNVVSGEYGSAFKYPLTQFITCNYIQVAC